MTDYLALALEAETDEDETEEALFWRAAGFPRKRWTGDGTPEAAEVTDAGAAVATGRAVWRGAECEATPRHAGGGLPLGLEQAAVERRMGGEEPGRLPRHWDEIRPGLDAAPLEPDAKSLRLDTAPLELDAKSLRLDTAPPGLGDNRPRLDAGSFARRGGLGAWRAQPGGMEEGGFILEPIPMAALAGPPSQTAWAAREERSGGRRGEQGAEVLYASLRRGERSREWAQGRREMAAPPAAETAVRRTDPAELDLAFQRDARRYGGAFTLY